MNILIPPNLETTFDDSCLESAYLHQLSVILDKPPPKGYESDLILLNCRQDHIIFDAGTCVWDLIKDVMLVMGECQIKIYLIKTRPYLHTEQLLTPPLFCETVDNQIQFFTYIDGDGYNLREADDPVWLITVPTEHPTISGYKLIDKCEQYTLFQRGSTITTCTQSMSSDSN